MQPPRSRTPRIDLGSTETLRQIILNVTAVLTTVLLMRFATLLVVDADDRSIPGYIQLVTDPLIWPFRFIPLLGDRVIQHALFIDILIIPAVAITGLFICGVLAGWRESGSRRRHHPAMRE